MQQLKPNKDLLMTDEEFRESYYTLSVAQRRYIFDRKYISSNPKTKEVLIRKGYVFSYYNREKQYIIGGVLQHTTQFTKKCHDMVEHYCNRLRKKQKEDFPDHIVIENDEQLLMVFQEMILLGEEDCIYYHRGTNGFLTCNDVDYIIHPYYKWLIEIDKTCGKFLRYESVTSHKGSYCHVYKGN